MQRFPRVCAAIYDCEADMIGIGDGASNHLERQPGETLQELASRAFASGTMLNVAAIYREIAPPELPGRDLPIITPARQ